MRLVVVIEGGLVQSVLDLDASKPQDGVEYEVLDYDILEDNGPDDVRDYFERRSDELKAYMQKYLPDEWETFQAAMEVQS